MSKFNTLIPVDIEAVRKKLPKGAHVHAVQLGPNGVHIVWDHDELRTPYTFPVDFPVKNLEKNKLPVGVEACGALKKPGNANDNG